MENEQLMTDLLYAYYEARKHKRHTINQLRFEQNFERELFALCNEIINRTYQPRKSICFIVDEPVKREIFAADFRDRVIHHFLYKYINPIFETTFLEDSYSCRKGKGTLYGIKRVAGFIRECSENYTKDCYILKLDIQGYFMNIDKSILKKQVFELLKNREEWYAEQCLPPPDWAIVDYLLDVVIDNNPLENCFIKGQKSDWNGLPKSKSLFHSPENCGLPIGNLTSQLFSNVYLHIFDVFMKNDLKLKYYGRYVDDFVVIDTDKENLIRIKKEANSFLVNNVKLELHPKKVYLQHYKKGVKFLGIVIKPNQLYASARTRQNIKKCLYYWNGVLTTTHPSKDDFLLLRSSVNSYLGYMRHFKSFRLIKNIFWRKNHRLLAYGYFTGKFQKYQFYDGVLNPTLSLL